MVSRNLSRTATRFFYVFQNSFFFSSFYSFFFLFKVASILAKVIPVAHSSPEPALMPFNTESYPGARDVLKPLIQVYMNDTYQLRIFFGY